MIILPFKSSQVSERKSDFSPKLTNPFPIKTHSQPQFDVVNFKGSFKVIEHSGIPCAYCGKVAFSLKEQRAFGKIAADLKDASLRRELMAKMHKRPVTAEKRVAELIIKSSKMHYDKNMQEILVELAPDAEKRLVRVQAYVLAKAYRSVRNLTGEARPLAQGYFAVARASLNKENDKVAFKRKEIIEAVMGLYETEKIKKNQTHLGKILRNLSKLPTAGQNKDAFIVKYQRRSPRECAEMIVRPYVLTKEHIQLDSKSGVSRAENYLAVDSKCNGERGEMPFQDFIDKRPLVIKYVTKNLAAVEQLIKKSLLADPNHYLFNVSRTIDSQSEGKIKLPYIKEVPVHTKKKKTKKVTKFGNL